MEERKLVDIEEVKDVLGDTINSEGDYRHALRLLNGLSSVTEQEIVKPYLEKLRAEIEQLRPNLRPEQMTDYDYAMVDAVNDIVAIINKYKAESEENNGTDSN